LFRKLKLYVFRDRFLSFFLALEGQRSHNPFEEAFFFFCKSRVSRFVYLNVKISQLGSTFLNNLVFVFRKIRVRNDRNAVQRVACVRKDAHARIEILEIDNISLTLKTKMVNLLST